MYPSHLECLEVPYGTRIRSYPDALATGLIIPNISRRDGSIDKGRVQRNDNVPLPGGTYTLMLSRRILSDRGPTYSQESPNSQAKVPSDIWVPEIAERSNNNRICIILLEIFNILLIFYQKVGFAIFVSVASVNFSICNNKFAFDYDIFTFPPLYPRLPQKMLQNSLSFLLFHQLCCFYCFYCEAPLFVGVG